MGLYKEVLKERLFTKPKIIKLIEEKVVTISSPMNRTESSELSSINSRSQI